MEEKSNLVFRTEVLPSDVETVRTICASTGNFFPAEVNVAAELVTERLAKGEESGYYFVFAEENATVVGYTCYGPIACTEASFDLYWIAVDPVHQKKSIGRALMERTECAVATMRGKRIYVETSGKPGYLSTRLFYQHCGYNLESVLKDFYSSGDDKVIFLKCLGGNEEASSGTAGRIEGRQNIK